MNFEIEGLPTSMLCKLEMRVVSVVPPLALAAAVTAVVALLTGRRMSSRRPSSPSPSSSSVRASSRSLIFFCRVSLSQHSHSFIQ